MTATNAPTAIVPVELLDLAHENSDYGDCCAMCGKRNAKFGLMVETAQGCFPIGTSCAKKIAKLGYLVLSTPVAS